MKYKGLIIEMVRNINETEEKEFLRVIYTILIRHVGNK